MARSDDYMTTVRNVNRSLWASLQQLSDLQREWNALDYGNTMAAGSGANAGITKTEIGSVVFDTANAFVALLNAGHATNMAKLL